MGKDISSVNEYLSFLYLHKIADGIRKEEGYDIAGHLGIRVGEKNPPADMVGILKNKPPLEKRICGITYNKKQRATLLGELWNEDKKLVLKVYGQENYLEASKLIKKHLAPYKIKIGKIVYQDTREEGHLFDQVA